MASSGKWPEKSEGTELSDFATTRPLTEEKAKKDLTEIQLIVAMLESGHTPADKKLDNKEYEGIFNRLTALQSQGQPDAKKILDLRERKTDGSFDPDMVRWDPAKIRELKRREAHLAASIPGITTHSSSSSPGSSSYIGSGLGTAKPINKLSSKYKRNLRDTYFPPIDTAIEKLAGQRKKYEGTTDELQKKKDAFLMDLQMHLRTLKSRIGSNIDRGKELGYDDPQMAINKAFELFVTQTEVHNLKTVLAGTAKGKGTTQGVLIDILGGGKDGVRALDYAKASASNAQADRDVNKLEARLKEMDKAKLKAMEAKGESKSPAPAKGMRRS